MKKLIWENSAKYVAQTGNFYFWSKLKIAISLPIFNLFQWFRFYSRDFIWSITCTLTEISKIWRKLSIWRYTVTLKSRSHISQIDKHWKSLPKRKKINLSTKSAPRLEVILTSVAWSNEGLSPLDGKLVHRMGTSSITFSGTHLYAWVKRCALRMLGFKPWPFDLELSALTMRSPCLHDLPTSTVTNVWRPEGGICMSITLENLRANWTVLDHYPCYKYTCVLSWMPSTHYHV